MNSTPATAVLEALDLPLVRVLGPEVAEVFTAFWLNNGRVLAEMHINDWDAIGPSRRILAAGRGKHPPR